MQKKIIAATLFMQAWVFPSMAIEPSNSSLVKRREALQYIAEPLGELESCLGDFLDSLLREKEWAYEAIKNPDIIFSFKQLITSKKLYFRNEQKEHLLKILNLLEVIESITAEYNKNNETHLDLPFITAMCDTLKKQSQELAIDSVRNNTIKNIYILLLKIKPLMECIRDEEEVPLKDSNLGVYLRDLCAINKVFVNALDIARSEYCSIEKEIKSQNFVDQKKQLELKNEMSAMLGVQELLNDDINRIKWDINAIKEIFKNNIEINPLEYNTDILGAREILLTIKEFSKNKPEIKTSKDCLEKFSNSKIKIYLNHIHVAMDTGCNFGDQVSLDENIQALSAYFSADDTSSAYTEEIAKYFKETRKEVILAETIHELENLKLYIDNSDIDDYGPVLLITKKLKEAQQEVEKASQNPHNSQEINSKKEEPKGWDDYLSD